MSSKASSMSRRDLVSNLGAGIAGAAIGSAAPALAEAPVNPATAAPFVDPTTKYPKPPYDTTQQPWPGLASKMIPPRTMVRQAIGGRDA